MIVELTQARARLREIRADILKVIEGLPSEPRIAELDSGEAQVAIRWAVYEVESLEQQATETLGHLDLAMRALERAQEVAAR
ncbi:MAG: hypothetical protein M1325_01010 [Actinobacteria bacterium]|nr:hypothetical protein [Actinomycetota bacterium]